MDDKDYSTHLLEEIRDQNKALLEGMKDVPKSWEFDELRRDVDALRRSDVVIEVAVADLSKDVKAIRAGVTDTSREVAEVKHRVTRLEAT
jgi:predicted  nucleic acid-binding Zn-ribbon protein